MSAASTKNRAAAQPIAGQLRQLLCADAFDHDAWEKIVASDVHVRIGNAPTTIGKDAALGELEHFFMRVESIGCGFCEVWKRREAVFAETEVQFSDSSRRAQSIPCTIIARVSDGNLCDLRIHLDPSPIP